MKVFVGGRLYDSRRDVIGVVLSDADKRNIANMPPEATIYSEFVPTGDLAVDPLVSAIGVVRSGPGRVFTISSVEKLLDLIKERTADPNASAGEVGWIDDGVEREGGGA